MTAKQRRAYEELREGIQARGGTMTYERDGQPKGGAWIVTLGGKTGTFLSDGNGFPELDMLYIPKRGPRPTHHSHYTQTLWKDAIDQLVSMLG
jgi:hypothetical protein